MKYVGSLLNKTNLCLFCTMEMTIVKYIFPPKKKVF